MRVSLTGHIDILTGFAVSFNDGESKKKTTMLLLPKLGGMPYIPASTIGGSLRHASVALIINKLAEINKKPTLEDALWLSVGGVIQKDDESKYDLMADRPRMRLHPWALWGWSQPVFMARMIQIESATPVQNDIVPDILRGQRTDPIQRGEVTRSQVTNPKAFDEYLTKLAVDRGIRKSKKNGTADENQKASTATNMSFSREILPPNTRMNHHACMDNTTDLHFGLFLATLRHFANSPYLGAKVGANLGLVNMAYNTNINGEDCGKIEINGRERRISLPKALKSYEECFWENFPKLNFSSPR